VFVFFTHRYRSKYAHKRTTGLSLLDNFQQNTGAARKLYPVISQLQVLMGCIRSGGGTRPNCRLCSNALQNYCV